MVPVLPNDRGRGLQIVGVSQPQFGSTELVAGEVYYVPKPDFSGRDTCFYTVMDSSGAIATAAIQFSITPQPDPPVAQADWARAVTGQPALIVNVVGNDFDPDGDALIVTAVGAAEHDSVEIVGNQLRFVAEAGYNGQVVVPYVVSDGQLEAVGFLELSVISAGWTNPGEPCDVTGEGAVTALDVLTVINYVNSHLNESQLPPPSTELHPYCDVNGDGLCTAVDVLLAINHINGSLGGEGEASVADRLRTASDSPQTPLEPDASQLGRGPTSNAWLATKTIGTVPDADRRRPVPRLLRSGTGEPIPQPRQRAQGAATSVWEDAATESLSLPAMELENVLEDIANEVKLNSTR